MSEKPTFELAKPGPDDIVSLDMSSLSSSTELPLDMDNSRQQLSDMQV